MLRCIAVFLFVCLLTGASSCKKDLLHFRQVTQLNSQTKNRLNNIRFLSDSICIIGGGDKFLQSDILRSADGGYTWTATSYATAPKGMYGLGVSASGTIYLSGIDGDVLHSKDSGKSWQFNRIDNWLACCGGTFFSPDTGIFVSTILQRGCTITRVDSNFKILDEHTQLFGLNNLYMVSSTKGYIIGYGTVMVTTDRGNTWNFQDVHGDDFTAMEIHGDEMWLCGSNGGIYHTTDAGINWQALRNGNDITQARYSLRAIVFKDSQNGWTAGDDGKLLHTEDGGKHWAEYDRFTTNSIRSLAICPNGDLLTAGDNGCIFRVTTR